MISHRVRRERAHHVSAAVGPIRPPYPTLPVKRSRRATRHDLITTTLILLVVLGVSLGWGLFSTAHSELRSGIGLFTATLGSPLMLVFPLVCVFVGGRGTAAAVSHRFASQLWPRLPMTRWLRALLIRPATVTGVLFFGITVAVFSVTAFGEAALFPERIEPTGYGLTAETATEAESHAFAFSQFLSFGYWAFGIAFSLVVAVQAALYCSLGQAIMLSTGKPVWGFVGPLALYFVESVIAALFNVPSLALMYLYNPAGLTQPSLLTSIGVLVGLAAITAATWVRVFRRRHRLSSLA